MVVLSFLVVVQAGLAAYNPNTPVQSTGLLDTAAGGYGGKSGIIPEGLNSNIPTMIGKIVGAVLALLGVAFFCIILYAGLNWILSMGNEEKINQAKDMIMAAVLGLIVVLGAYAVTALVSDIFK